MTESIWTRKRRLIDHEKYLLHNLRMHYKSLGAELANDDWGSACVTSLAIHNDCLRMQLVERELENVTPLVDGYERINKRIEELEKAARDHGIMK